MPVHAEEKNLELRVLVDVSGSMKKTDPRNLRQPAVRMVAGLLPENSKSGIWTFSSSSNMLVPFAIVENDWRERARNKSYQINSPGLHTDIENALNIVTAGWLEVDKKTSRQLILLTDGQVDVGNNRKSSNDSRQRIIDKVIPRLKEAGVIVHTISLSDATDERLMDSLAISTDGMFLKATSAEDLKRLFSYLWQKATHAEVLPIENNYFEIDKEVKEVTLLLMHDRGNEVSFKLPDGSQWYKNSRLERVKWYEDNGYSLVTIANPQPGTWKLVGKLNEETHVVVISDLNLKVDFMPSNILAGETVRFKASMLDKGSVISGKSITDKIKVSLRTIHEKQDSNEIFDKPDSEGIFYLVKLFEKPGEYEIRIRAEGPTFQREYHDFIVVHDKVANVQMSEDGKGNLAVDVRLRGELLKKDSIEIKAMLPGGESYGLEQLEDRWAGLIPGHYRGEDLVLSMAGKRHDGQSFIADGKAKIIPGHDSDLSLLHATDKNVNVKEPPEVIPAETMIVDSKREVGPPPGVNWLLTAGITGAFLGVFVMVMLAGLYYFKKKKVLLVDELWSEVKE